MVVVQGAKLRLLGVNGTRIQDTPSCQHLNNFAKYGRNENDVLARHVYCIPYRYFTPNLLIQC